MRYGRGPRWDNRTVPCETLLSRPELVFKYSCSTMLTTDWSVVIIVLVIALGSWIIYGGEIIGGALVISGCGLFVPLYLNAKLARPTFRVDDIALTAIAGPCARHIAARGGNTQSAFGSW